MSKEDRRVMMLLVEAVRSSSSSRAFHSVSTMKGTYSAHTGIINIQPSTQRNCCEYVLDARLTWMCWKIDFMHSDRPTGLYLTILRLSASDNKICSLICLHWLSKTNELWAQTLAGCDWTNPSTTGIKDAAATARTSSSRSRRPSVMAGRTRGNSSAIKS